ncbi:hypothetical protein BpHYR1_042672 [Brachionus plicatilis]|uniref:Uncharacterized protein n=1 Tax=Brachionus plicatilis TaxID=10195 RepID=A0A3M7R2I5_BRAPC|nr:hypothetical protein BpHYR1_042672 [Brachionus plicatilis]
MPYCISYNKLGVQYYHSIVSRRQVLIQRTCITFINIPLNKFGSCPECDQVFTKKCDHRYHAQNMISDQ